MRAGQRIGQHDVLTHRAAAETERFSTSLGVRPDATLLEHARRALPDAQVLPIGTSARVGGTSGCTVEAMEGFAVLRACAAAGVPALELRVVSNRYGESSWRFEEAFALLGATLDRLDVV